MTLEWLIIGILATYRLTYLINSENAPFNLAGRFRTWIGIRYDERSQKVITNQFAEMVNCFYCLSIWMGLLVFIVLYVPAIQIVVLPFALSGGASMLKRWVG